MFTDYPHSVSHLTRWWLNVICEVHLIDSNFRFVILLSIRRTATYLTAVLTWQPKAPTLGTPPLPTCAGCLPMCLGPSPQGWVTKEKLQSCDLW